MSSLTLSKSYVDLNFSQLLKRSRDTINIQVKYLHFIIVFSLSKKTLYSILNKCKIVLSEGKDMSKSYPEGKKMSRGK